MGNLRPYTTVTWGQDETTALYILGVGERRAWPVGGHQMGCVSNTEGPLQG